jgi:hypothetical protein
MQGGRPQGDMPSMDKSKQMNDAPKPMSEKEMKKHQQKMEKQELKLEKKMAKILNDDSKYDQWMQMRRKQLGHGMPPCCKGEPKGEPKGCPKGEPKDKQ